MLQGKKKWLLLLLPFPLVFCTACDTMSLGGIEIPNVAVYIVVGLGIFYALFNRKKKE